MGTRAVSARVPSLEVSEGAGVTVRRAIGLPRLPGLDPFLMLDHFSSDDPRDYLAGFPDHPHRGFVTLTYMIDGRMLHQDSMGNRGELEPGGAQWMKAASGVIHSEMPRQSEGLMRGFQLWVNLPAAEKMSEPAYQEVSPGAVPETAGDGLRVRVLAGEHAGRRGPIEDPHTQVLYLDVRLGPRARFERALDPALTAFLYVFEGGAEVGGTQVLGHELAVLGPGDGVSVQAGEHGARLVLAAGRPLGEPVVQHGPFVMSSREEIEQAFADYRDGRLVRSRARVTGR